MPCSGGSSPRFGVLFATPFCHSASCHAHPHVLTIHIIRCRREERQAGPQNRRHVPAYTVHHPFSRSRGDRASSPASTRQRRPNHPAPWAVRVRARAKVRVTAHQLGINVSCKECLNRAQLDDVEEVAPPQSDAGRSCGRRLVLHRGVGGAGRGGDVAAVRALDCASIALNTGIAIPPCRLQPSHEGRCTSARASA